MKVRMNNGDTRIVSTSYGSRLIEQGRAVGVTQKESAPSKNAQKKTGVIQQSSRPEQREGD